jgi:hypothetical protein
MQDLFFSPQVPNPIPLISQRMEYQSYKFQLKEVPSDTVFLIFFTSFIQLKALLNEPTPDQAFEFKGTTFPNVYAFSNL